MERQAYYFARIEVALEGLRAGVKHPAMHELLDIIDEARYCLEAALPPLSDKSNKSDIPAKGKRRGRPAKTAGPYSAASKEQERAERALIADLQEVIDRAGSTNIPDAIAEFLQCDIQPDVIFCLIGCTLEEFAALRDGEADAELAGKFLAVFKLKGEKEA